ncbi:double zinc ribbon domain-containing protein [Actibacterium sp. XHP0104]|uniref:double zinc ribbon domain-containing protein n=1 Tax=Actibacterium sp. XHP0104 TaxID=2984335 RepID=UPI0021E84F63|nr:double zinc ribbon domain-containing protein [Actibacterium sp. XHP0104]MCV2882072.1 double zinc ribbon domain-containing protein [Actibacterium sp. XHP0104]
MNLQSALEMIYPPTCISCGALVEGAFGLCGPCWRDTHFINGLVCDCCGVPLPGEDSDTSVRCDDCMTFDRPWARGRAALVYKDNARRLVLALKHGDRADLARPGAGWMLRAGAPIFQDGMLVAPIPLHRWRLLRRRYNQSALLSARIAAGTGYEHCPDLLIRARRTESQDGKGHDARFSNLAGAIRANPRRIGRLAGRHVLLIDDVMTSGATMTAASHACFAAGAKNVSVLVLARVAKEL